MPYPAGIVGSKPRIVSGSIPWKMDKELESLMNDGIAGWNVITDEVAGNNGAITSNGGSASVYPDPPANVYPYLDGVGDWIDYGNVASVSDRLAVSWWVDAPSTWPSDKCLASKSNVNGIGGGEWYLRILGTRIFFSVYGSSATITLDHSSHLQNGQSDYYGCFLYDSSVGIVLWDNSSGSLASYTQAGAGGTITGTSLGVMLGSSYFSGSPSGVRCCESTWKYFAIRSVDVSRWSNWLDGTYPALEYAAGSGH